MEPRILLSTSMPTDVMGPVEWAGPPTVAVATRHPLGAVTSQQVSAFAAGQVIVKLKDGVAAHAGAGLMAEMGATVVKQTRSLGIQLWNLNALSVEQAIKQYAADPRVEYIEPNYTVHASVTPNDPSFTTLWGLHNTGQSGGTVDADIDAPEAWNLTTGSHNVIVGVIDTGVDYTHPDLAANIWTNPGEIAGNGIDDDHNGYVDDVHGYDFVSNDGDPMDDDAHGTHVSGTIAGVGNNSAGVAGVNWHARIMGLKFLDENGSGSTFDAVLAVEYATLMGAHLTSNSWGGGGFSQSLYNAISAANSANRLFIAAAGNESSNNDASPSYPASYDLPNVISVAASDRNDRKADFSNYGATSVDLAAPGVSIYSTIPGGGYASYSGTSMATPHVSGVAALVLAANPSLTAAQLRERLLATVDPLANWAGVVATGGRLNAYSALLGPAPGSISGSKWADSNANGLWDSGEAPLPGVTIYLDRNDNGVLDGGDVSTSTNAQGQYTFANLDSGSYVIREVAPANYQQTFPVMSAGYEAAATTYEFIDISGTGAVAPIGGDDAAGQIAPSGFSFPFYDDTYQSLYVSTNGLITFGSGSTAYTNTNLSASPSQPAIAVFWDDLVVDSPSNVYYQMRSVNSQNALVIQWNNVAFYGSSSSKVLRFQTILFPDGSIRNSYGNLTAGNAAGNEGASATVGIKPAGTSGDPLLVHYNQTNGTLVGSGRSLLITPLPGTVPDAHRVTLASGQNLTGLNFGNYMATPQPEIEVLGNGVVITDGDGSPSVVDHTHFGATTVGGPALQRTFTVRNTGVATLTISNFALPAGFQIAEALAGNIVAGSQDTFTVTLSSSNGGEFTGDISFTTNDADEIAFNFAVAGLVSSFGSIAGTAWNDADGNAVRNGEPGMVNAVVYLDGNSNSQLDWQDGDGDNLWDLGEGEQWTTSGTDGTYLLSDVPVGSQRVQQVLSAGYTITTPGAGGHQIVVDGDETGIDFGNHNPAPTVSAATLAIAETATPGTELGSVTGGDLYGDPITWAITAGNIGSTFAIDQAGLITLAAGKILDYETIAQYILTVTVTDSLSQSSSAAVTINVQDVNENGVLTGFQWNDVNGDGTWDAGEPALPGWTVFVDENDNRQLDAGERSDVTDQDGRYAFEGLLAGRYIVRAIQQPGWRQTSPAEQAGAAVAAEADVAGPDPTLALTTSQIIVKLHDDIPVADVLAIRSLIGATVVRTTVRIGAELWDVAGMSVHDALMLLGADPRVQFAQPNYTVSLNLAPNDPSFASLWGLDNQGQTGGSVDADIDAPEAWNISTGSSDVVVAVIDTGVDYTHPDLAANIWTNPGEIAGNGIDDDGNGYIDDMHGYDFVNNDGDPMDDHSHGTHVSGTIAGVGNNAAGVTGVNWTTQIMALKFLDDTGSGSTFDAVLAVEYATLMGADLSSNSWGGGGFDQALYNAIAAAGAADILFIAAAGNDASDIDASPFYPASYDLPNVISVAASDHNDHIAGFSNYGATSVDLAAPGVSILSTVPGGGYATYSGTSMATPHVAGVAALLLAANPGLSAEQLKARILASVDVLPQWSGLVASGGRLNAFNALAGITTVTAAHEVDLQPGQTIDNLNFGNTAIAPVADAGGPYVIDAGQNVTLDASGSYDLFGADLTYGWDLDQDGVADVQTSQPSVEVPASTLTSLAVPHDGTPWAIELTVENTLGAVARRTTTLTINPLDTDLMTFTVVLTDSSGVPLAGDASVHPGDQIRVQVHVREDAAGVAGVGSWIADLLFDSGLVTPVGFSSAVIAAPWDTIFTQTAAGDGYLDNLGAVPPSLDVMGNGVNVLAAEITFQVAADISADALVVFSTAGPGTQGNPAFVLVNSLNDGTTVPDGDIAFGAATLHVVAYETWDVNRDGVVNTADMSALRGQLLELLAIPGYDWPDHFDLNNDGLLNTADLSAIRGHLLTLLAEATPVPAEQAPVAEPDPAPAAAAGGTTRGAVVRMAAMAARSGYARVKAVPTTGSGSNDAVGVNLARLLLDGNDLTLRETTP